LANTFFRAGYIESWGRGIQKICEEYNLIGAKIPEYSILGDDITVKFTAVVNSKAFNRTNDVRKGKGVNTKVLELIKAQTDISLSEMADRLGVSYKTVQRAVADLKMSYFSGSRRNETPSYRRSGKSSRAGIVSGGDFLFGGTLCSA